MPAPHDDQKSLEESLKQSTETSPEYVADMLNFARTKAREGITKVLDDHGIDLILGPGDCGICIVASFAGWPSGMVPMTRLRGKGLGQPQGLMMISRERGEGHMIHFASAWESLIGRLDPPML